MRSSNTQPAVLRDGGACGCERCPERTTGGSRLRADLYAHNRAAADARACVTGGLRGKIVSLAVNDDGSANDIPDGEPIREERLPCVAAVAQQRRKIAGMRGMRAVAGVEMPARIGEGGRAGAARTGVDVERKDVVRAGRGVIRKAAHLDDRQRAAAVRIEMHGAAERRVGGVAPEQGAGGGACTDRYEQQVGFCVSQDHHLCCRICRFLRWVTAARRTTKRSPLGRFADANVTVP